jgi:broad specificity phosphatase PhoE
MLIHLLRHGQFGPDHGQRLDGYYDPPLNDVGVEQAQALGTRLRRCGPIEALYTSDLRRTRQTADVIAPYLDATPHVEPRLREIYRGELEEKPWEVIREEYPDFYREWQNREIDVPYPRGESGREVWQRASAALDEITRDSITDTHGGSDGGSVAIVTHGGTIMILLSGYLGLDMARRRGFRIDTCSISTVEFDASGQASSQRFTVTRVNDTAHLE